MHIGTDARGPRLSEVDPLSRQSYATPSTPLGHERLGACESCPPIEEFRMCEWAAQPHARVHRQQNTTFRGIYLGYLSAGRVSSLASARRLRAGLFSRRPRVLRALAVAGRSSCYPHVPLCLVVVACCS